MGYSLNEVSEILRGLGASLELRYSSGGFSVVLYDIKEKVSHTSLAWNIEEAFGDAFQKLQDHRIKRWEDRLETTNPGIKSETKKVLR